MVDEEAGTDPDRAAPVVPAVVMGPPAVVVPVSEAPVSRVVVPAVV